MFCQSLSNLQTEKKFCSNINGKLWFSQNHESSNLREKQNKSEILQERKFFVHLCSEKMFNEIYVTSRY